MIKKIIFLTVALLLISAGAALFVIAPYHIYTLTLTEGVKTNFLVMDPSAQQFYDGHEFAAKAAELSPLFSSFHFSHFQMSLPINHPTFYLIPTIKSESSGPRLGASFLDGKNAELVSFIVEKSYKLQTSFGDQKLFLLPVFKNHIHRKSESQVWHDLFSKKLTLPSNLGKSFYESLMSLKEVTYSDLVYNLYILYNRTLIFPKNTKKIFFNEKNGQGIVELVAEDPKYKEERLFILENDIIYSLTIRTKILSDVAQDFRNRLLNETSYKNSTVDSAIPIYAQYKTISYSNRVDQQGMTYLFSAWSHDLNNREFVRVIILFLERGQSNLKFLKPFYEYAFKKFGSNLSGDAEQLIETAGEKLKRKASDELIGEIKSEEDKNSIKHDGNFSSRDEKIKYFLQKAKDNKKNSDNNDAVLIQE